MDAFASFFGRLVAPYDEQYLLEHLPLLPAEFAQGGRQESPRSAMCIRLPMNAALSRLKHGFESRRERQRFQLFMQTAR